jgi:hypothetical protein
MCRNLCAYTTCASVTCSTYNNIYVTFCLRDFVADWKDHSPRVHHAAKSINKNLSLHKQDTQASVRIIMYSFAKGTTKD